MVTAVIPPLRRWTVEEYMRLVDLGLFDRERVELVDGLVVAMSPAGTRHFEAIQRLNELLVEGLRKRGWVRVQSAFRAGAYALPEPDLAVVPREDYSGANPTRAHLIIEVAESSLDYDRTTKSRLYAEAGVTEYWIVNLVDHTIEVHTGPEQTGRWGAEATKQRGDTVAPVDFPDIVIPVAGILPR